MKKEFEKRHIRLILDEDSPELDGADYVWVHHQVIPSRILDQLTKNEPHPVFIFLHMSALPDLLIEQPYIFDLERRIATKSLFIAKEAISLAKDKYYDFEKFHDVDLFPNPVPPAFLDPASPRENPKKILIVSNHPTPEVERAAELLSTDGIKTDLLGKDGNYRLISPQILNKYDLVITIAKSVQYCLCMGIPVYIYDHFGGCGYLNSRNYNKAASHNFSGRGFQKKTAKLIASEILKGYKLALDYQLKNRQKFCDQFSLENNLERILSSLKPNKYRPLTENYLWYIKSAEKIARDKVFAENMLIIKTRERDNFQKAYIHAEQKLENVSAELSYMKQAYNELYNSRTMRIGRKIHKLIGKDVV